MILDGIFNSNDTLLHLSYTIVMELWISEIVRTQVLDVFVLLSGSLVKLLKPCKSVILQNVVAVSIKSQVVKSFSLLVSLVIRFSFALSTATDDVKKSAEHFVYRLQGKGVGNPSKHQEKNEEEVKEADATCPSFQEMLDVNRNLLRVAHELVLYPLDIFQVLGAQNIAI